ncbi:hypothetical protein V2A88_27100, partial [Pseudomonas aeruginosa]
FGYQELIALRALRPVNWCNRLLKTTTAASSNPDHHRVSNGTVNVAVQELRGQKQVVGNERKQLGTVPPSKPTQP